MNRLLFALVASASALQLANLRNPDPLALEHKAVETTDENDEALVTSDENEDEGPLALDHDIRPSHELPQKFHTMWEAEGQFNAESHGTATINGASFGVPHGDGVKLVVGIPMMTNQQDVRNAHLSTWMKGDGVCNLDSFATPSCHIFPVFLYGNSSEAVLKAKETEFGLSLQVPEPEADYKGYQGEEPTFEHNHEGAAYKNMRGKSYEWFKHAGASYPKATHIAKMDSDAYPHMASVLHDLATGPQKNLYWGSIMGADSDQCKAGFMQGAFYIISADLQPCRQRQVDAMYPDFFGAGHGWNFNEDGLFGGTVFHAVESGKCPQPTCMHVKHLDRYVHPV